MATRKKLQDIIDTADVAETKSVNRVIDMIEEYQERLKTVVDVEEVNALFEKIKSIL